MRFKRSEPAKSTKCSLLVVVTTTVSSTGARRNGVPRTTGRVGVWGRVGEPARETVARTPSVGKLVLGVRGVANARSGLARPNEDEARSA